MSLVHLYLTKQEGIDWVQCFGFSAPVHWTVKMRTRSQNWTLVMITMDPMHWSIGRNPSPKQDMSIIRGVKWVGLGGH